MKTLLLLSLGVLILILGVTGRTGVFLMSVVYPANVKEVAQNG